VHKPEDLTIEICEKGIKEPAHKWHKRCHEIAHRIVDAGLVEGSVCYGHYLGPIDPDGRWSNREGLAFQRHGWILLPDGRILDPTRFSFENKDPYLYIGENADEYDEGGNVFRGAMMESCPSPDETNYKKKLKLKAPAASKPLFEMLTDTPFSKMTFEQLHWVANIPYNQLDFAAGPIYQVLIDSNFAALIPIDNRRRAKREGRITEG